MVDWQLAVATARRLVSPGPRVDPPEAAAVVAELRRLSVEAEDHVARFTGMVAPPHAPPVAVVDRISWVTSNVAGFKVALAPVLDKLTADRPAAAFHGPTAAVGRRITGVQVGLLLSFLASRVLGQYEVFLPADQGTGRLSLVAPNILATERALDVVPRDFRLWVCLHEVTHRTQFTAVPWLKGHVESELRAFVDASELDPAALWARLRGALTGLVDVARGRGEVSLLELVQTPDQRAVLDRLQAFMSLVEGHAEYVMDGVGPDVIPSLAVIRRRFDQRRSGVGPLDRALRRLLGLDLKMRQYAEGARFVRAVVDQVGMAGFNQVWADPQALPTRAEITDAPAWVARVHGPAVVVPGA
jgi:coenzyme F420 biosynthesis associated uncharacterized protein